MILTEGSGVADSIFGKSQAPIRMFLEKRGEQFEQQSIVKEIFQMSKSGNFGEKFTNMTAMSGFKAVGENGTYPEDSMQEGFSKLLEHMTWKDKFVLSQEIVEDAKLMDLKKKPAAFLAGYYRTREKFGAAVLGHAIQGAKTMDFTGKSFDIAGADTEALFAIAHPSKVSGGTQSNLFKDAFSADTLGAAESAMQIFKGDNDEILEVSPDTIVIPNVHTLKKAVFAAIGADKDPETANNGFNYQFGRWRVIIWSYLNQFIGTTNKAPWVLMDSTYNQEIGSLVWLDRVELSIRSDIDPDTDANQWKGRARFIAGVNDWRGFLLGGGGEAGSSLLA